MGFCSQVFVETETPPSLFVPVKSERGGYGEMTVWKQRFYRWNFFFLYRLINDIPYLLFAWRLGWREIIVKFYVFAEVYSTLLWLSRPFVLPIMFATSWKITLLATGILTLVYIVAVVFFNAFHLRRKGEMVRWQAIPVYFAMKVALVFVNTVSIYHALYAYTKFFSVRHFRVVDNRQVLDTIRGLQQQRKAQDFGEEAYAEEQSHREPAVMVDSHGSNLRSSAGGAEADFRKI